MVVLSVRLGNHRGLLGQTSFAKCCGGTDMLRSPNWLDFAPDSSHRFHAGARMRGNRQEGYALAQLVRLALAGVLSQRPAHQRSLCRIGLFLLVCRMLQRVTGL
jgi:hypothetical protein